MAKKQVSIPVKNIEEYFQKGQLLNFVMNSKAVFLAQPISVKSDTLKVKNTKGHIVHLPLAQIEEIWGELKAD